MNIKEEEETSFNFARSSSVLFAKGRMREM